LEHRVNPAEVNIIFQVVAVVVMVMQMLELQQVQED
jgi:hypothetical protein